VLTYVVRSKDKTEHIAVEVGLKNGVPTGTWTNLENGKKGPASSKWPDVVVDGPQGLSIESWFSPTAVDGESAKVAVRIGENPREVDGHKLADGSATVLAGAGLPILLEWRRGDVSLRLESATPVAFGSTRDADTGLPAPASVALTRTVRAPSRTKDDSSKSKDKKDAPKAGLRTQVELRRVDTAADGSFALAVPAEKRRLILVLDRSGSMIFSLNPRDGRKRSDLPAPAGKQRMDYLRRAVHGLLDKTPPGVEVTLWSFATGPVDRDDDNPRHVKIECPFTTDLDRVRKAMDAVQITNGTPITGAIHKILNHVAEDPLSANAHIVLLTDGENTSSNPAAKAYQDRNGSVPIHTIGFAIEAGGKAEKELRDIAEVSGGTYRIAGTGDELALAFAKIDTAAPDTRLAVTSTCHAPENIVIPAKELGGKSLDVRLSHGCATCKCSDKSLLTIRKDNVARLDKCVGLSPKARSMIEDRVKDGLWTVTIPSVRVNLGVISAYAWWETENATGRMVGRTEDGLHGATMDPRSWPGAAASGAGNIPFVAWYMGIVAYTAGSVEAAMRWTREPGFMAGGPEGFKRFVQANALDFCGRWWSEVGASAFPENIHNYWSGVCFNFALQSMALGLPAGNCFRQWAGAMCDQAAGAAKGAPGKAFDDYFGKEYREIYTRAKKLAEQLGPDSSADVNLFMDEMDRFKKAWDEGIDRTFPCDRLRGGSAKLP
jgi:hypothetical protein